MSERRDAIVLAPVAVANQRPDKAAALLRAVEHVMLYLTEHVAEVRIFRGKSPLSLTSIIRKTGA